MSDDLDKLIAQKKEANKSKEIAAFAQIISPLTDAIDELADTLNDVKNKAKEDNYDKELGQNLSKSIDKISEVISKIKQSQVDLSPILSIATEIKSQNKSLIDLVDKFPKNQSNEPLIKEIFGMIERSNRFVKEGLKQVDYSKEIAQVRDAINSRPTKWEFDIERLSNNAIRKVTAIAK